MPPPPRKVTKPGESNQPHSFSSAPAPVAVPTTASSGIAERSEVKGSGKAKGPVSSPRQIGQEEIARRAFEIYAGRGYAQGDSTADWLEAERQLKAGL